MQRFWLERVPDQAVKLWQVPGHQSAMQTVLLKQRRCIRSARQGKLTDYSLVGVGIDRGQSVTAGAFAKALLQAIAFTQKVPSNETAHRFPF